MVCQGQADVERARIIIPPTLSPPHSTSRLHLSSPPRSCTPGSCYPSTHQHHLIKATDTPRMSTHTVMASAQSTRLGRGRWRRRLRSTSTKHSPRWHPHCGEKIWTWRCSRRPPSIKPVMWTAAATLVAFHHRTSWPTGLLGQQSREAQHTAARGFLDEPENTRLSASTSVPALRSRPAHPALARHYRVGRISMRLEGVLDSCCNENALRGQKGMETAQLRPLTAVGARLLRGCSCSIQE